MSRIRSASVVFTFGTVLALLIVRPPRANAQARPAVVRIPDAPTCATCSTTLERVATIGRQLGPGDIDGPSGTIREDRQGRFWLLPMNGELPRVYSSKGVYLGSIGRKGAGPGEFSMPAGLMLLPGDSLLVVDVLLSRATVVGPDLKPGRTLKYPQGIQPELVVDWPNSVVLQGWIPAGKQKGLPLHRASLSGRETTVLNSFSPNASPWTRQFDLPSWVRAVPGKSGFWTYNEYRYRFTQWSADGKMIADFERDASLFPRQDRVSSLGNHDHPPAPNFVRIVQADEQRVWALTNVPSPNWKHAWDRADKNAPEVAASRIDMENLFDSVIEEIDLKTGRVLSRTRSDKWIIAGFDSGRIATYEVDAQGVPSIVIYALVRRR